jgi:hypothetical protein
MLRWGAAARDRRRARAGGVVADAAREREVAADLVALVPVLAEAK